MVTIWQQLKRWLDPSATLMDETFSLGNRGEKPTSEEQGPHMLADARMRTEAVLTRIDQFLGAAPQGKQVMDEVGDLTESLQANLQRLKQLFRAPTNKDLVVREITISTKPPTQGAILFLEGLTDKVVTIQGVLEPLMLLGNLDVLVDESGQPTPQITIDLVEKQLVTGNQVSKKHDLASAAEAILSGDTVVLIEGSKSTLAVETKSPPVRSVAEPKNEQVIWGPHDAFNEAFRVNIALVRRRLKDPRLVTEVLTVGEVSSTYVGMTYIDTIVSPKLVAEVKRRVEAIKVDIMNSAGVLEQYIEDSPGSLLPTCLITERPDRAAAYLSEGHVVLFVDTTPYALVCPTTFWSLLQTSEDYYLRWPFGTVLRYIRALAVLIALTLPALYIAVVNYHQEMIPTELMLFIAASRELVPMPAVVELLIMDLLFELVREAGTRIPGVIGPTLGLVASLILGQAAVEAKIVSPVMILVVAITGLSSFAIPNYTVGWGIRGMRFLLVLLAMVLGFFGVATGLFMLVVLLAAQRSFGLPYLSPISPSRGSIKDVLNVPHLFKMEARPTQMRPLNKWRQKPIVRSWDPYAPESKRSQDEGGSP